MVGERSLHCRVEEFDRRRLREWRERERREPVELVAVLDRVPHRHQQADAVGVEPAGEKPERVGAVLVQPLRVVDDDQELTSRRGAGDECQRSETNQELIRRHVVAHPECRFQCARLRRRQRVDALEEGRHELVQGREAESHLGLDADEAQNVEVLR